MASTIIGVDIDSTGIRAVEVRNANRPNATVVRSGSVSLPVGAVRSGEVLEPGTVESALRSLWQSAKFSTRNVALGFGGAKVFAREVALPRAPIATIREQLPFTVQEMIPLPVAEAMLDFYPAVEEVTEEGPVIRGILVAAQKDAVRILVGAVMRAKLTPVAVDLNAFGIIRALGAMSEAAGVEIVVAVGPATTDIAIIDGGVPRFVRILPTGGDDIVAGIASRLKVTSTQAEQIMNHYGILASNATQADRPAVEAVYAASWDLLAGIRDTLVYFAGANRDVRVDRVVLAGSGAGFPGFEGTLSELSGLPVARTSLSKARVASASAFSPTEPIEGYLTAYGLALGVGR